MEATLTRLGEVENLLADPDVYADGAKASALLREFHELQTRSEGQLEALGELEAQISALEAQRAALSLGAGGINPPARPDAPGRFVIERLCSSLRLAKRSMLL